MCQLQSITEINILLELFKKMRCVLTKTHSSYVILYNAFKLQRLK